MKSDHYFTVHGWMINELKLKGAERDIYAIIYRFSADQKGYFTGSIKYLCDSLMLSKSGVLKTLQILMEKKLISKKEYFENNIKYCKYQVVEKVDWGGTLSVQGVSHSVDRGGTLSGHNNRFKEDIIIDKEKNKEKENASLIFFESIFEMYKKNTPVGSHKSKAKEQFQKLTDIQQQKLHEYLKEFVRRRQKILAAKGWVKNLPTMERFIRNREFENVDLPEVEETQTKQSSIKIFRG